jgi:hypothetical protein
MYSLNAVRELDLYSENSMQQYSGKLAECVLFVLMHTQKNAFRNVWIARTV